MEVSEAKLLKALEVENARLKKLLAEQALDAGALRAWIIAATGSTQGRSFAFPPVAHRSTWDRQTVGV